MKAHLSYWYYQLKTNFWLAPALMVAASVLLAFGFLWLDSSAEARSLIGEGWPVEFEPASARMLLSTIAGATITVVSLVFSITLVVLTLASSELGPRLLSSFMQDKTIQFVLGTFVGGFVYALLVLAAISDRENQMFVPSLSIMFAVLLVLICFLVLIVFIHHVANFIQADTVVARVASDLDSAIDSFMDRPEDGGYVDPSTMTGFRLLKDDGSDVCADDDGYVQAVGYEALNKRAVTDKLCIHVLVRPGHFVVVGQPLARIGPADSVPDETQSRVRGAIVLGHKRTMTQDVEYAIRAIVEVGLRALSPGVNDSYTAVACVDRLSAALRRAMKHGAPRNCVRNGDGDPRVVFNQTSFGGLMNSAFDEIRQSARGNASVLIRMLEALATMASMEADSEQIDAIKRHAAMIARAAKANLPEPSDRRDVANRLRAVKACISRSS